jgi:hypothetical protein
MLEKCYGTIGLGPGTFHGLAGRRSNHINIIIIISTQEERPPLDTTSDRSQSAHPAEIRSVAEELLAGLLAQAHIRVGAPEISHEARDQETGRADDGQEGVGLRQHKGNISGQKPFTYCRGAEPLDTTDKPYARPGEGTNCGTSCDPQV